MPLPLHVDTLDLLFQGMPQVIAAFVVRGPAGPVLIETGPGSTLPTLLAGLARLGIAVADVRHVLVTHIHLDHAGAAGFWAREGARVYVHRAGAAHLVDPTRLLASARRIYGERMDTLWGEVLPAPAERVVALDDGATLELCGLTITALATPGHAGHHHAFRIGDVGFVGDATGIRLPGVEWIDLPAPPPEFDLEAWRASLAKLRGAGLRTLWRTHFGAAAEVESELARFERLLDEAALRVRELVELGLDREAMVARYSAWMRERAAACGLAPWLVRAYELANPRTMSVDGIVRYWSKAASGR